MNEEIKEKQTTTDTGEGDKPSTTPLIDEANEAAKRLEEANARKEELLAREEEIEYKKTLGGKSKAGTEPEKPKELTDTEYAEALERGEVNPLKEDGLI